ncbi:hypothetical protein ACT4UT_15495 [Bacillus sp. B-TM1]
MLHTMPSYTERIQEVLPHAKIIRLIGYTNGNKEYQKVDENGISLLEKVHKKIG